MDSTVNKPACNPHRPDSWNPAMTVFGTKLFLLAAVTYVFVVGYATACQDGPHGSCDPAKCAELDCAGGTVLDRCNCCRICLRSEGDQCGGETEQLGRCQDGLLCVVPLEQNETVRGNEAGTCQDKKACDSLQTYSGYSSIGDRCVLVSVHSCTAPHFQYSTYADCEWSQSHMYRKEKRVRGQNCSQVNCIVDSPPCPSDSYRLPSVIPHGQCCPIPQGCSCLPRECSRPTCPPGTKAKVLRQGTGKPGYCCDTFQCVNATSSDCIVNGAVHHDGSKWRRDKCTTCKCQGGITLCEGVKCPQLSTCGRTVVPKGQCCPMCVGCISQSGIAHNNSDTWKEDDCTTCQCLQGQVFCQEESCQRTCLRPQKVAGYCCPLCEDPFLHTHPVCEFRSIVYADGEHWDMDECTRCVCVRGLQMCKESVCLPPCEDPIKVPGQCCPVCKDTNSIHLAKTSQLSIIAVVVCVSVMALMLLVMGRLVLIIIRQRQSCCEAHLMHTLLPQHDVSRQHAGSMAIEQASYPSGNPELTSLLVSAKLQMNEPDIK